MKKIKNKEQFNSFINENKGEVSVVKFGASWCTPCRVLESTINSLTLDETKGVYFAEVDADEADEELLEEYTIRNIPVLLFFKDGLLSKREMGLRTKAELLNIINEIKNK